MVGRGERNEDEVGKSSGKGDELTKKKERNAFKKKKKQVKVATKAKEISRTF